MIRHVPPQREVNVGDPDPWSYFWQIEYELSRWLEAGMRQFSGRTTHEVIYAAGLAMFVNNAIRKYGPDKAIDIIGYANKLAIDAISTSEIVQT